MILLGPASIARPGGLHLIVTLVHCVTDAPGALRGMGRPPSIINRPTEGGASKYQPRRTMIAVIFRLS